MSIVQLIVGLNIIVIIGSMVFTQIDTSKYETNSFIRQLVCDIRYVRQANILGDDESRIILLNKGDEHGYVLIEFEDVKKEVKLPNSAKIKTGNTKIQFNLEGMPNKCAMTISITEKDKVHIVTITPVSGRVLYKEGQYE